MRWRLFATLAETVGEGELVVSVDAEEPTVREALNALLATHPELESAVIDETGELHSHINLLYDGVDPFREGAGWETTVETNAELALFPPMTGG